MGRKKSLVGSAQNFALWTLSPGRITNANFGDDRLSRFCVARGQILGFRRRSYTIPLRYIRHKP